MLGTTLSPIPLSMTILVYSNNVNSLSRINLSSSSTMLSTYKSIATNERDLNELDLGHELTVNFFEHTSCSIQFLLIGLDLNINLTDRKNTKRTRERERERRRVFDELARTDGAVGHFIKLQWRLVCSRSCELHTPNQVN